MNNSLPNLPPTILSGDLTTWVAIASVALYLLSRFLARRNEGADDRKRRAIQLAGDVRLAGLDFLAPILEDYAVGDHEALTHRIESLARELGKEQTRKEMMDRLFNSQLGERLRSAEGRRRIARQVEQARAA